MSEDIYKYNDEPIFLEDVKKLTDEQKDKMRVELEKRVMDFKETFSTAPGARVLFYLMHEMYVFRSFGQHNAAAYAKEGRREMGNELFDMLGAEYILERLITAKKSHTREKTDE